MMPTPREFPDLPPDEQSVVNCIVMRTMGRFDRETPGWSHLKKEGTLVRIIAELEERRRMLGWQAEGESA